MSNNLSLQPFESFFVMRPLSPSESEIHLVGGASLGVDRAAAMAELTTFVRSCLEVLGEGSIEITPLGEECWSGIRVGIGDTVLDTLARQSIPRLHDALAGWIRHLYPGVDVVWRPR